MSLRSFWPSRWTLGVALFIASACGRNDVFTIPSAGTDDDSSGGFTDTDETESVDTTEGFTESADTGDFCGNDVAEPGEECDGNDLTGLSCQSLGFQGGTLSCTAGCNFDTSDCSFESCGDGFIDPGEECDGFDLGGLSCQSFGFGGGSLGCTPGCTYDFDDCDDFFCGNDVLEPGEACDGFDLGGESCMSLGFDGGTLACRFDCQDYDVGDCVFSGGDCCNANGTPGCDDPSCEAEVCAADAFCCSTEWDQICADIALGVNTPGVGCLTCSCGDGVAQDIEVCDGLDTAGVTCLDLGFDGGTLACTLGCTDFDTSGCTVDTCGNGTVDGAETCDGLDLGGQTCASLGFAGGALACTGDCSAYDTSGCLDSVCGNGTLESPPEICDGLDLGGQDCISLGFMGGALACAGDCSAFDTSACVAGPNCGNDMVEGGEVCDGTDLAGQTCPSLGFAGGTLACAGNCGAYDTSGCLDSVCGNGTLESPPEVCDGLELGGQDCVSLGFMGGALACSGDCLTFDTSGCVGGPMCGDDMAQGAEVCDGTDLGGQDCVSQGFMGGVLACLGDCSGFDTSMCVGGPVCGDDMAQGAEVCDGTDLAGQDCVSQGFMGGVLACLGDCSGFDTSMCVGGPVCGDDMAEGAEVCDGTDLGGQDCVSQGFAGGVLACLGDCSGFDTSMCMGGPMCGNDFIEGAEVCDGADLGGEDCVSQGFVGGALACLGDCTGFDTSMCVGGMCGNDFIEGAEVCDGTDLGGQDCVSQGFAGGPLACVGDCSAFDTSGCTNCGNDMIDAPEVCDGTDLAGLDCVTLGFDGGVLNCLGDCSSFDTGGCTVAGDDCCAANGSPGCNNATCEAEVCAINPFCCIIGWDAVCAGIATGSDGGGNECLVCTCGNGALDGNETCDGADLAGETCATQGFAGGNLGCQGDCSDYDTSGCFGMAGCGNGTIDAGEVCDGADLGGETCVSQGFAGGNLGCQGDCSGFDTSMCMGAFCGNDMVEGAEQCDGMDLAGEDCASLGLGGGTLACAGDCTFDTSMCNMAVGNCCAPNMGMGCADPTCSGAICALDPDCCAIGWDAMCADAATGADGGGNECEVCGSGGCAHPLCETGTELSGCMGSNQCVADICAVDAFCCSNAWDGICVNQVGTVCNLGCP